MKFLGFITFILLLSYSSYPTKTKRLEKELKILKRNIKGGNIMSKIIRDLKGQKCLIKCTEALFTVGDTSMECNVIDVDDEWIKISYSDKKKVEKTKNIRIDTIESIELIV